MRTRRTTTIEDLRRAIHALPRTTRTAMLEGMAENQIIVGAYTHRGGICPMLAAHRNGGRTSLISFARAWDRFAFAGARATKPRPATPRELLVLRTHLEASLLEDMSPQGDLGAAISEHRELVRRRAERPEPSVARRRPGDPDRSRELRSRPGWAWTRLVRRYDDYQQTIQQMQAGQPELEPALPA